MASEDGENKNAAKEKKGKIKLGQFEKQVFILFGVLLLVFIGFLVSSQLFKTKITGQSSFVYKGFTVHKRDADKKYLVDFYYIPIRIFTKTGQKDINIILRNDPRELEGLGVKINDSLLYSKEVWVTTDVNYSSDAIIARGEVGSVPNAIGIITKYTFNVDNELGYEKITCENATLKSRVIDIRLGNETKVYGENKCIIVEGANYTNMIKAADSLAFYWLDKLYPKN